MNAQLIYTIKQAIEGLELIAQQNHRAWQGGAAYAALNAIDQLQALVQHYKKTAAQPSAANGQEWIGVADRMPDCLYECTTSGTNVSKTLLLFGMSEAGFNSHGFGHAQDDGKWVCYEGELEAMNIVTISHWMLLPQPPAVQAQDDGGPTACTL